MDALPLRQLTLSFLCIRIACAQVCQLTKEGGSNPEFFRFYAQLASACQPIMMARDGGVFVCLCVLVVGGDGSSG